MIKKLLPAQAFRKLAALYADMQSRYSEYAQALGLTCDSCPQNCCTSFFQHHTRIEWAYLLHGLSELPADRRAAYEERSRLYVRDATDALARGERPSIMCPLNDGGRCGVYAHRLMICRLHGVPNRLRYPDGRTADFPGCFRSQELCAGQDSFPVLDRTALYTRLMELEVQFVGPRQIRALPRVDLTLAEMIVRGNPTL
ncbi:MAG: hypothetical protein KBF11_03595 [Desulfomicrobium sp.]|nr:hypothetical protein [Desulfomicrobium sp.]